MKIAKLKLKVFFFVSYSLCKMQWYTHFILADVPHHAVDAQYKAVFEDSFIHIASWEHECGGATSYTDEKRRMITKWHAFDKCLLFFQGFFFCIFGSLHDAISWSLKFAITINLHSIKNGDYATINSVSRWNRNRSVTLVVFFSLSSDVICFHEFLVK